MALLYEYETLLILGRAMEPTVQIALISISVIVVVAALAFAGYILIRNNKGSPSEHQLSEGNSSSVSKDDLAVARKQVKRLAEENGASRTIAAATERAAIPLKISNLRIEPVAAKHGEMITIWFDATNLDSWQVGHQVTLRINGQILNIRQVSILPNTILHLNFKVSTMEPGIYTAEVNGTTGQFTIRQ
jgi:hypothetical protein